MTTWHYLFCRSVVLSCWHSSSIFTCNFSIQDPSHLPKLLYFQNVNTSNKSNSHVLFTNNVFHSMAVIFKIKNYYDVHISVGIQINFCILLLLLCSGWLWRLQSVNLTRHKVMTGKVLPTLLKISHYNSVPFINYSGQFRFLHSTLTNIYRKVIFNWLASSIAKSS